MPDQDQEPEYEYCSLEGQMPDPLTALPTTWEHLMKEQAHASLAADCHRLQQLVDSFPPGKTQSLYAKLLSDRRTTLAKYPPYARP
jgi:hypothetical protein